MVMVYIGEDDPTRGDSHGFKGIGQRMAQKLNGRFHYLEDRHLNTLYPGLRKDRGLKRYLEEHGKPDIVFTRSSYAHRMMTRITPLMMIDLVNEHISSALLQDDTLVAHHLTPEIFDAEGKKFRENYPDIKSPILAVMMVHIWDTPEFAEKIVSKCAQHEEPLTVFICSSRRTESPHYTALKQEIEERARKKGLEGRLFIEGYNFAEEGRKENTFNPYIGLIQEAEHILVAGESVSMVSEPLAAGKRVMVHGANTEFTQLKRKGLVIDFSDCAADTRFETPRVEPVNVTEDVADRLVDRFNAVAKRTQSTQPTENPGWLRRTLNKMFGL